MRSVGVIIADLIGSGMTDRQKSLVLELAALAVGTPARSPKAAANARYYQRKKLKADAAPTDSGADSGLNSDTESPENILIQSPARVSDKPLRLVLTGEDTSEAKASSVSTSKRGARLAEEWMPSEIDREVARKEGLTEQEIDRAAREFVNFWCAQSRNATKLSWPRTWANRVAELGERKRREVARMAAKPRVANGRDGGNASFADLFLQRHGQGQE